MRRESWPFLLVFVGLVVGCAPSETNIERFSSSRPFDSAASFTTFLDKEGIDCRLVESNNDGYGYWDDYWGEGSVVECKDPNDEPYWAFIASEPDWKYRLCVSNLGYPEVDNTYLAYSIGGWFGGWGYATIVGESYFLSIMYPEDSFYTVADWQKVLDGEVYEYVGEFCDEYRALWEQE